MTTVAVVTAAAAGGQRVKRDWPFWTGVGFLVLVVLLAALAPLVAPHDPARTDFGALWLAPSAEHLLGTDQLGRDLLSRLIHGARPTLLGSLAVLAGATVLGVAVGLTAAWRRGWVDTLLSRITDVMFAFPSLLFVVLLIAVFSTGTVTAVLGLALAYTPNVAKFTRSIALGEIALPYVESYRLQGVGGFQLCVRYVLPNLVPALLGYLVVLFGDGLMSLAALNFIGFGSTPPSSDWGLMVSEARSGVIQGYLTPVLVPGLAIALVAVATNVVGVRLADKLAVRK